MNIYDKAHEFAEELKNLKEVVDYRVATENINNKEENKKIVEDFRKVQIEAYSEQMSKGVISEETKQKMQNLGAVAMTNPDVANYLQSEARFAVIWEDLLKILNDAIGVNVIAPESK
ncbi:YlbF family regulator [Clostridium fallax]|uniref:Cell fate regulator YlbF, YheA/YmcA/DUF963 family (Controls sporulation, competence, biofilm development) n=1 Tax=Clostridium fallax TaxID=1533 RepID=A0A1M4X7Q5_9CLOT|nr:YlbF family regulator [Clostridium fallax]SHE89524.1 Cell fate regulator YlbF, YheA/YmcA/DUF963 family (controls sporulation, competence, biofilm development) [Clostridium fallax]SQB07349.1 Protein of uncharacterised function (DUF964) [Clostridium fallax]